MARNASELNARKVLVTGGTGGLGHRIAEEFRAAGDVVAITSRTAGADAWSGPVLTLDLEDLDGCERAVGDAIERLGGLDTLVVNAVRWPTQMAKSFEELARAEWQAVLRANVEGAFAVVQTALPALRASRRGRIVLVSSGAAEEGHPVTPHYVTAKAALHGFGRVLAWDGGRDGVLTNVIAVGFTRTPTNQGRFPADVFEAAGRLTPQRRVSSPEDVARAVYWLGSDLNTSITGEVPRGRHSWRWPCEADRRHSSKCSASRSIASTPRGRPARTQRV
jgi:NAD(P)-dependent dehydrogenase (short-subunit alcohol dehydrogenase family)